MSNFSIPGGQGVAKGSFLVNVTPTGAANIDDFSFNSDDVPSAVAVDPMGNLWIAGIANSDDIVTTPGAFQTNFGGNSDGFLIELDPSGIFTLYSTYLGGSSGDGIEGLAIDSFGNPYLTGFTQSSDFPSTTGVFQPNLAGAGGNAFVAANRGFAEAISNLNPNDNRNTDRYPHCGADNSDRDSDAERDHNAHSFTHPSTSDQHCLDRGDADCQPLLAADADRDSNRDADDDANHHRDSDRDAHHDRSAESLAGCRNQFRTY